MSYAELARQCGALAGALSALGFRAGVKTLALGPGDSLLFDATALHGIEAIGDDPVSYLSVVFTLRG